MPRRAAGRPARSAALRGGHIMEGNSTTAAELLCLDIDKASRRACGSDKAGRVTPSERMTNRPAEIDAILCVWQ